MQERYWRFLVQLKADVFYTTSYAERNEFIDNGITIFSAIISSTSVGAWAVWKKFDIVWAILIATAQVITVIKQYLPYKKRIAPMRAISYALDEIYLKAESRWLAIASGALTETQINDALYEHNLEKSKAWKKCVGDTLMPIKGIIQTKSDEMALEYFRQTFNTQGKVRT